LHAAVAGEKAAAAGVEGLVIFKHFDRGGDSVEGGATALENVPSGGEGTSDAAFMRRLV
jgi:hypothetical protein